MGLGKTVQSISFISAVLQKTGTRQDREELKRRRQAGVPASACGLPFLIVAPASVVRVWMDHLETWGHFESFQLESGKDIDRLMSDLLSGRVEVVTTSYDLLRLHANRLTKTRFEAVLFDEYHTIKSASAMVSQAACELRTKRVFGFTGTLIQNDMKEFWFLAHLIDPLAVGEQTRFTEHFSEPIKRARSAKATNDDRRLSNKRLDELDSIRSKIMIQRTKEAVLADLLLGKSDTVVFCDVSEVQRDLYLSVLALPEFQLLKRAKEPCDCGRRGPPRRGRCCYKLPYDPASNGGGGGGGGDGIDPRAVLFRKFHATGQECPKCPSCCQLAAVAKLQKIANHPCLLQENLLDTEDKRKNQRLFAEVAFTDRAKETMGGLVRSQNFLKTSKTEVCGKLAALEILLEKFYRTRDKVLVFSWSTTMLDVIESFVGAKGYSYRRLDGSTQAKDRRTRIKDFNSDRKGVFVFLISTGAGGQGLNLCTASRVVMYDANWNPAKEAQAQDRAYRIGQKNKVAVFRLISKGTIEEVIYMRQIYKLQITSAAMGDEARGGRRQFYAVQGSKGEEGELFGIQNLLKFSDDSLLKALRTKYDTSSRAGGGSNNAGNGGNNAKNLGVDAADEGELLLAMQEGVGRAQQEQEESGDPDPEDAELADLLGVLGLDAYTHDELVAKDEGEEELTQEASVSAELPLSLLELERPRSALEKTTTPLGRVARGQVTASSSSAIPVGSPLKFRRSLIPAQPGENITAAAKSRSDGGGRRGRIKNSPVTAVTDTTKRSSGGGAGSGAVGLVGRSPKARPGVISPLKLERVSREGTPVKETRPGLLAGNGGASSKTVSVRGAPSTTRTEAVGGCMERQPALPQGVVGPAPPHEPCKRRRNLDWGRGAGVVKVGLGDGAGGSGSGGRYKLFTPRYGASSGVSGGGGGGEK